MIGILFAVRLAMATRLWIINTIIAYCMRRNMIVSLYFYSKLSIQPKSCISISWGTIDYIIIKINHAYLVNFSWKKSLLYDYDITMISSLLFFLRIKTSSDECNYLPWNPALMCDGSFDSPIDALDHLRAFDPAVSLLFRI